MIAPSIIRSQFSHLYGATMLPVLEELFKLEMERHPSIREKLFKVVTTDRDIWQSSSLHDLDLFQVVGEGTEYSFDRPKQGASKTLVVVKYGLGASISEECISDGKVDLVADIIRKLGRSGRESQEIVAANIFNNGFSSETTDDAVAVFSASHTLPSGGTFSNILSTPADLSPTSLDAALTAFETNFVGDSGIIYRIEPRILLVHTSNRRYANELIGSTLKPDTNDNNMNSLGQEGLTVVSSPHLVDPDAWFLLASPAETGLRIVSRTPIETTAGGPDLGFVTDTILYKSRYREVVGVTHAYGIFGTSGG